MVHLSMILLEETAGILVMAKGTSMYLFKIPSILYVRPAIWYTHCLIKLCWARAAVYHALYE